VPPRRKTVGPPTMADLRDTLWRAADKLRGSVDASQYKDFVLGLVFLKYVSDAFGERREAIRADVRAVGVPDAQVEPFLEDKSEYLRRGAFWVPRQARWDHLAGNATSSGIGRLLDAAMDTIMRENGALAGVLPKIFDSPSVDQRRLGELVDLLGDARFTGHRLAVPAQPAADGAAQADGTAQFAEPLSATAATKSASATTKSASVTTKSASVTTDPVTITTESVTRSARDVLGEVYEYFLERFARAEGKRGGEFYTPASVVRLMVEIIEPYLGRVYDPCCGSGGMFVQAERLIDQRRGRRGDITVYGQELNERTWRLAKMNLAIHGVTGDLGSRWDDTLRVDLHPDLRADFVLANPPFNMSDWARATDDPRWRYGVPPAGNANFAWMQHIISKLAENGVAGVVMANGSMSSRQSGEGEIRAALVEADLVACMVALPPQLFRSTQIPACLWFFAKNKTQTVGGALADRRGETLFIDARGMGKIVDRTERVLTDDDLTTIADTYRAWRGTAAAHRKRIAYADIRGFCYSATSEEIRAHGHVLAPGRYVGAVEPDTSGDEPNADKITRLTGELLAHFEEAARLEKEVRTQLECLDG